MTEFKPDWVSPPGDTIVDILVERSISRHDFARQMGTSTDFVDRLLCGDMTIDDEIASKLSEVLGSTKEFWIERERQYHH